MVTDVVQSAALLFALESSAPWPCGMEATVREMGTLGTEETRAGVGHQNGSSHLRVTPCRLGPRKPAAKVKGKNPNAAESQGDEVPADEVVGQGRRAGCNAGGRPMLRALCLQMMLALGAC